MTAEDVKRPGLVTFAGVMMILLGFFELVSAIELFREASWAADILAGDNWRNQLIIWGIVDLIIALFAFYAGYSIFKGANFGRWAAVIIASVSAIRWFWMIPYFPWMGLTIIFIDVLIIYGLMQHWEWFNKDI